MLSIRQVPIWVEGTSLNLRSPLMHSRHLSDSPMDRHRVYVLKDDQSRWLDSQLSSYDHQLRSISTVPTIDSRKLLSPKPIKERGPVWTCVDASQLDLRKCFLHRAQERYRTSLLRIDLKETGNQMHSSILSSSGSNVVQSLIELSPNVETPVDKCVLMPTKPTPPGPEDCCMSGKISLNFMKSCRIMGDDGRNWSP